MKTGIIFPFIPPLSPCICEHMYVHMWCPNKHPEKKYCVMFGYTVYVYTIRYNVFFKHFLSQDKLHCVHYPWYMMSLLYTKAWPNSKSDSLSLCIINVFFIYTVWWWTTTLNPVPWYIHIYSSRLYATKSDLNFSY